MFKYINYCKDKSNIEYYNDLFIIICHLHYMIFFYYVIKHTIFGDLSSHFSYEFCFFFKINKQSNILKIKIHC